MTKKGVSRKGGSAFYGGGSSGGKSSFYGGGGGSGGGYDDFVPSVKESLKDVKASLEYIRKGMDYLKRDLKDLAEIQRETGETIGAGEVGSILAEMEEKDKILRKIIKDYKSFHD